MPFEKKTVKRYKQNGEKYKDYADYKQKNLYFDTSNAYQSECIGLLELCGHKQAKFLGLLVHEYIIRNGISINQLDKKKVGLLINILEERCSSGFNPVISMQSFNPGISYTPVQLKTEEKEENKPQVISSEEEFLEEEDVEEMNDALAAFGVI